MSQPFKDFFQALLSFEMHTSKCEVPQKYLCVEEGNIMMVGNSIFSKRAAHVSRPTGAKICSDVCCLLPLPILNAFHDGDRSFKNRRLENEGMENDALWTGQDWCSASHFLFIYFFAWLLLLNHPVNAMGSFWTVHWVSVQCFAQKDLALRLSPAITALILLEATYLLSCIPFAERY